MNPNHASAAQTLEDYDWEGATNWYRPQTGVYPEISVARKQNGKLIFAAMINNGEGAGEAYEGEILSVEALVSQNNTVQGLVGTGIHTDTYGRCCVFNVGDDLYLSVFSCGTASIPAWYKIYHSPSGNGGDWILHGTLFQRNVTSKYYFGPKTAGAVTVLPSGRWVMPGTNVILNGDVNCSYPAIWTSDDGGVTWTWRFQAGGGSGFQTYVKNVARRVIALESGSLYFAFSHDYGGTETRIFRGTNNGTNWSAAKYYDMFKFPGVFLPMGTGLIENRNRDGFYGIIMQYADADGKTAIYKWTDPDNNMDAYSYVDTLPILKSSPFYTILTVFGKKLVLTKGLYVIGIDVVDSKTGSPASSDIAKLHDDMREASCVKDPIDTGTGAHVMERTLLTVNGAQELTFKVRYNSLLLNEGPLGRGWGHNFEARLASLPDGSIDLHWTANRLNRFVLSSPDTYSSLDLATRFDTITKHADGSFTLKRKDKTVYEFNAEGRLVQVKNKYGQPITLAYDAGSRLETITEAVSGRSLTLHYNANNLIDYVTDPLGRQVTFGYDGSHNLTSITDAKNHSITYTYNTDGRVESATDDAGVQIFRNTYDALGRVATQDDGVTVNQLTYFYYDEDSRPGTVITTVYDRNGNTKIFTHDSSYQLLSVTDELGYTNSYTYDADGNKRSSTDAKGRTTTYDYDARGNLLTETDPFGRLTTMTYDGNDNLTSLTNRVGAMVCYSYDDPAYPNNVTKKTDQLGNETNYEYYPENGLLKQITSPRLGRTEYTYMAGQVSSVTDAAYNTTTYGYDNAGRLTSTTDGASKTTSCRYDGTDNLLSVADPLGHTISYIYDCRHKKLAETDAKGNTTYYEYDNNGNLSKVRHVVGAVYYDTTYRYDGEDRLKYLTDANGNMTTYNYDAKGRLIQTIDPLGHTTSIEYDELDRITGKTDAMGNKTLTITYDDAANTQTVTDAIYHSTINEYDAVDRLFRSTDPMGRVTRYNYDRLDRLTSVINPLAGTSNQRFDADGNLEALTDPNNFETDFNYDLAGRLASKTFSSGGTITYNYNVRNLIERMTNARGQATIYDYYADGSLRSFADPAGTVSYQYDPNGNVETVTEGVYTITREYDELNRVKKYTDSRGNVIRYEYDPVGNLTVLTYPGGKQVNYTYYKDNRLKTVTDWNNRITTYEYYPNGLLWRTTRPNGTVQIVYYDDAGQITQLKEVDGSGNLIVQYNYTYKNDGTVETEQSSLEEQPFAMPDTVMTYTYDNRLATFNGQPVEYDADGNMAYGPLNGLMTAYTFDSLNRLTGVDGTSYLCDAENNRISVIQGVYRTEYVVNPEALLSQVLTKTDDQGNQTFYVYGFGLIAQEENGIHRIYHYDLRGSTVTLTDINGIVTDRFWYGPYGELVDHSGSTQTPFLYNGRDGVMTDENGLYYMRARYYNPEIKRFVNQDVLLGNIENGQSMNRYAYVEGDPVKYVDPMGLWTKEVHRGYTIEWAEIAGFTKDEALIIAEACQKVDSVFSLTNPAFGPSYHFYGPAQTVREFQAGIEYPPGQDDIRIAVAEEQLLKARKLMDNPKTREQGLKELGKGLHALQDIEAHMNISRSAQLFGYIFERSLKGGFMRIAIDDPGWDFVNGRWVYVGNDASQRFLRTRSKSIAYLEKALK